ncbi:MAG: TorF family putative porin [Gammaproteobacteria bacterium]|nr:TorF family putative porin [Gammaproteobacteria bacterium]
MKGIIQASIITSLLVAMTSIQAESIEISGNVTLTSDYSFRGWSQTSRDPAIQGGFDIEFEEGFSIGTWASNVNFGASTTMEWDLYAGYSSSINEDVSWSVTVIRFEYPSEGDAFDYMEFGASISYGDATAGIMFSQEYLGDGGPAFQYPYADYSYAVNEDVTLDLHIGMSVVDTDHFFGVGEDSYIDYSATITTPFNGIDVSAGLVGTTLDDDPATENRFILSFSKSL